MSGGSATSNVVLVGDELRGTDEKTGAYMWQISIMLLFSVGVTAMENITNESIRGTTQLGRYGEKPREA